MLLHVYSYFEERGECIALSKYLTLQYRSEILLAHGLSCVLLKDIREVIS